MIDVWSLQKLLPFWAKHRNYVGFFTQKAKWHTEVTESSMAIAMALEGQITFLGGPGVCITVDM